MALVVKKIAIPSTRYSFGYTCVVEVKHEEVLKHFDGDARDAVELLGGDPFWEIDEVCRHGQDSWIKFHHTEPFNEMLVTQFCRGIIEMEKAFDLLKQRRPMNVRG